MKSATSKWKSNKPTVAICVPNRIDLGGYNNCKYMCTELQGGQVYKTDIGGFVKEVKRRVETVLAVQAWRPEVILLAPTWQQ